MQQPYQKAQGLPQDSPLPQEAPGPCDGPAAAHLHAQRNGPGPAGDREFDSAQEEAGEQPLAVQAAAPDDQKHAVPAPEVEIPGASPGEGIEPPGASGLAAMAGQPVSKLTSNQALRTASKHADTQATAAQSFIFVFKQPDGTQRAIDFSEELVRSEGRLIGLDLSNTGAPGTVKGVSEAAEKLGVKPGWTMVSVDGQSFAGMDVTEISKAVRIARERHFKKQADM